VFGTVAAVLVADRRLLRVASALRIIAIVLPIARVTGTLLRVHALELDDDATRWGAIIVGQPFTIGMCVLLFLAANELRFEASMDRASPSLSHTPGADAPEAVAPPPERLLDSDAPIDLSPFLPREPPKMTAVPIGDPHGAFRRPTES